MTNSVKLNTLLTLFFLTGAIIPLSFSCQYSINPVEKIVIFIVEPNTPPNTGGWALGTESPNPSPNPHPKNIQVVFNPNEYLALGLKFSNRLNSGEVTFDKYTYFSRKTATETPLPETVKLGPFEAGQVVLVNWSNPSPVPNVPGIYDLRIYMGTRVVASAVFEVRNP